MAKKSVAKKKKGNTGFLKFIKWFWLLFASGVAAGVLVFLLASWGVFGKLPTFEVLENPQTDLASEIVSSDGETLGKFYIDANRTPVSFSELPDHLVKALIATEDERYYDHSGIDARGTLRAVAYMGSKGGASTITQQLAKLLFTERASSNIVARVIQKVKEWVIAVRLEKQYTKEEIIAMYLNQYDFGYNGDGIRSAARIYFGKEPQNLSIQESAMLVGMLKNSSLYNPFRREKLTLDRRNTVLSQMEKNDFLSEELKDSLQQLPLEIDFHPESHREGIATYFREYLRDWLKKWAEDPKNFKPDGEKYNIYLDGLKIYTTIDSRMQAYAEEAVNEHMPRLQAEFFHQNTPDRNPTAPFLGLTNDEIDNLLERSIKQSERWRHMKYDLKKNDKEIRDSFDKEIEMTVFSWEGEIDTLMTPLDSIRYYKKFLRTGMMSMEPQTGHVKAWVGGIDYRHFQYDQVKQGSRQVGSTFKPFVYAAAIDQLHVSPCDSLPDVQFCIEKDKYGNPEPWCPKNADGKFTGEMMSLKDGLANSVNSLTARLMDKVGPQPVVNMVKKLGVEAEILPVPSIGLGTPDISVYEMVGAYGTFANQGVYVKPVMVTRIEDKNGTVLYEYVPETRDVVSDEVAYTTVKLMEGVTQGGSGTRLRHKWASTAVYKEIITGYPYEFNNPIAGKTGTTDNQSDGWFMGMVPNLVTGVWVGAEDRAAHFASITYGQGASMALPIWALYMRKCYNNEDLGVSKEAFQEPEELTIRVDCDKPVEEEDKPVEAEEVEIDF
ncbi:penicillin-binding protein 1A [Zhouia amylolytica]|uniref:Membrane carboxypeptidase/penicillin-binding protein n=2 Tax=Zhouia amylolytica TaxID=376730 RepID=W2UL19_9FLAO|nr:transglycosylase domain-containing protein [Zhouia amylolytica]ETN94141.1 membrane carboxypeptidase/penicillin-binding protein [Zhouia amylolytica AD3]MCQ0112350.1 penicillin-binding protein [Zhouia amylolytica]SFS41178.1 penicillin-binding protein 1A [Zhouia amylolytica]